MVTLINQLRDFEPIPSDTLNRALRSLCKHRHDMEVMEKETGRLFAEIETSAPESISARQALCSHLLSKLQEERSLHMGYILNIIEDLSQYGK